MEGGSDGVGGGPVVPVGVLQGVDGVRDAVVNVGQYHSLEALHDDWSECYWPEVIQAGWGVLLGDGDDGRGLVASWDDALTEGEVEDGGENISQLVSTSSEGASWYVVRPSCFPGADAPQGFVYLG